MDCKFLLSLCAIQLGKLSPRVSRCRARFPFQRPTTCRQNICHKSFKNILFSKQTKRKTTELKASKSFILMRRQCGLQSDQQVSKAGMPRGNSPATRHPCFAPVVTSLGSGESVGNEKMRVQGKLRAPASYPDVSLPMKTCVPFPWSLAVHHQSLASISRLLRARGPPLRQGYGLLLAINKLSITGKLLQGISK